MAKSLNAFYLFGGHDKDGDHSLVPRPLPRFYLTAVAWKQGYGDHS